MSSTNKRAGNAAHVASSHKRKNNCHQVGSCTKRVAFELFPSHNELSHDANGGHNQILSSGNIHSFTSLLNDGHKETNVQPVPLETQEDPFDRLLSSQFEEMRETCMKYLNNKYNDLLRQAEEQASMICREQDKEMARMKNTISHFEEKLSSQNELINNKNMELENIRRRTLELEEQVVHSKYQAGLWKEKAWSAKEMLWNMSPQRQQSPSIEVEEGKSESSVGGHDGGAVRCVGGP